MRWNTWMRRMKMVLNPFATGCQIIIGDGLKGTDEAYVPVVGGEHVKEAKIGRAVMDADIFISLTHFKGHELTGFGGALKNIGMGCGSRAGKMEMHSDGKPQVREKSCVGCGACAKICAHSAITVTAKKAKINHAVCVGCGRCIGTCHFNAIAAAWDESNDVLNKKIAEYSWAVLNDRPHFHISLVVDVAPFCDCHAGKRCADYSGFRHVLLPLTLWRSIWPVQTWPTKPRSFPVAIWANNWPVVRKATRQTISVRLTRKRTGCPAWIMQKSWA